MKNAGGRLIDVTEPVAKFVAEHTGEPFFRPFTGLPAAFLYTPMGGGPALLVFSGLSCGSGVMGPHVQSSERLGTHNAAVLLSLANTVRAVMRPEQPMLRLADSDFGRLVGPEAARLLMQRAERLGESYISPAQRGGQNSNKAATRVYAAALAILGHDGMAHRLTGMADTVVGRTDPLIIAALLYVQIKAAGVCVCAVGVCVWLCVCRIAICIYVYIY